jgi:GH15 family glucan-1,4-alpha-glucosidase
VDDEHVLAFIEAIDRADLDAIGVFALYAVFVDDVGHG